MSTNTVESPENEVADVFPDFAVDPAEMTRRTEQLKQYVRSNMTEGEDYGIIPGGMKPTLFKPGAEKLVAVFGLSPLVEISRRHEDWDAGFLAYEIKVRLLNKRTQAIEAEGVGSCNTRERRYKNQDAANVANTILKMAKKRALIDATLSATRASGMFTQDLEDLDLGAEKREPPPVERSDQKDNRPSARPPQRSAPSNNANNGHSSGGQSRNGTGNGPKNLDGPCTDAQQRAIMAIAARVFGRHSREEDLARMVEKPLDELNKGEASGLIDRLRAMQTNGEQQDSRRI